MSASHFVPCGISSRKATFAVALLSGDKRPKIAEFDHTPAGFEPLSQWLNVPKFATLKNGGSQQAKTKMPVVGAVMHKLMRVIYGVLKSGQPFDPSKRLLANQTQANPETSLPATLAS